MGTTRVGADAVKKRDAAAERDDGVFDGGHVVCSHCGHNERVPLLGIQKVVHRMARRCKKCRRQSVVYYASKAARYWLAMVAEL